MTCPYCKTRMIHLEGIGWFCNQTVRIDTKMTRCGSTFGREAVKQ